MSNNLNPYAGFLGSRDPLTVIEETPRLLQQAAKRLRSSIDEPRAEGKWSPRQIIGHLADSEVVFAMRLRQTAAQDHHVIQPFDQDAWASANPRPDVATALAMFAAVRAANAAFIRAQPPSMMEKAVTHPERGTMTFRTIIETMAGHDMNHLQQLGWHGRE